MIDARAVLAGIPGFEGARLGARLSDGPTNASFRVTRGREYFVLRVDKPGAVALGLDREAERAVLEALAVAGLTERPVHADTAGGVLLRRWLPGRAWTHAEMAQPPRLARLARVLRALHALPPAGRRFDPLGAARRYAEQLGTPGARERYEATARAFAAIGPGASALCHNDPVCGNILEGEDGPVLIDWEYAGIGDPYFDLAVVVQHHDVAPVAARDFLHAYLGRPPAAEDLARLERQCRFYRHLLDLWHLRTGGRAVD